MKRALLFCLFATAAAGLNAQTWVASTGSDTLSCGARTSPCATFAGAFTVAPTGGVIQAADAGNFGSLTITHAITIDGSGIAVASGATAISITAGASDRVEIQDLKINATSAAISAAGSVQLYLYNVAIVGRVDQGIVLGASDATGTMTADNIRVTGAISQGLVNSGFSATVKNSTFAYAATGVQTQANYLLNIPGSTTIERCHIASNSTAGIQALNGSTIRLDNTEIFNNQNGILLNGGQVISYRTNTFANNAADGTPSLSASQK